MLCRDNLEFIDKKSGKKPDYKRYIQTAGQRGIMHERNRKGMEVISCR